MKAGGGGSGVTEGRQSAARTIEQYDWASVKVEESSRHFMDTENGKVSKRLR